MEPKKAGERSKVGSQLPLCQDNRPAGSLGIAYQYFIWANNFVQPALPGMPERPKIFHTANRDVIRSAI